ncbi:rhodopsin, GQ-coupled-like [Mytilus californianus]|uniref:rhodopsin, GQ-coupled-like n=1 Tax=Mytilus californianus TaxID=6549 RepID=UPI002246698F|nr:rhodopsin, GQ-coupled-like [Mytilus californianus]
MTAENFLHVLQYQFPLLHDMWKNEPEVPYGVHILIGFVALIIGTGGLIGNLIVICLFVRYKSLRRSANLFVLNLAVGDTLLIVANVPLLVISSFHAQWIGGVIGCHLFAFFGGLSGFVCINTLTVLAIERCVVITCHLTYNNRLSNPGVVLLCVTVWIYSIGWSVLPYLGWGGHMMEGSRTSCTFDYFTKTMNNRTYVICLIVFCFVLQLIIISVSYLKIVTVVFSRQREISHSKSNSKAVCLRISSSKERLKVEWRATKAAMILVVVFCISWTPYAIIALIGQFSDTSFITPLSSAFPGLFAKMSSLFNPIIYTLLHSKYRKMIRSIFKNSGEVKYRNNSNNTQNMKLNFDRESSSSPHMAMLSRSRSTTVL